MIIGVDRVKRLPALPCIESNEQRKGLILSASRSSTSLQIHQFLMIVGSEKHPPPSPLSKTMNIDESLLIRGSGKAPTHFQSKKIFRGSTLPSKTSWVGRGTRFGTRLAQGHGRAGGKFAHR